MPSGERPGERERDYLAVIRVRRGLIGLTMFVTVALSLIVSSLQTPVYEGTTDFVIEPDTGPVIGDGEAEGGRQNEVPLRSEISWQEEVHDSVRKAVAAQLGHAPPATLQQVGKSQIIRLRVESADPEQAALIANTYVDQFIEFRRQQRVEALQAAVMQVQRKVEELPRTIGSMDVLTTRTPVAPTEKENQLGPRREALVAQQALYKQTLDELLARMQRSPADVRVVARAVPPTRPIKPNYTKNGLLGLGVGLLIGVGLAFLLQRPPGTRPQQPPFVAASAATSP